MAHIEVFQCPSCGANLSYDGGPETSFPCQFCGTTVVVPEEMRPHTAAPGAADYAGLGQGAAGAMPLDKLAEIKRLTQNGQKIEAIKVYREITGVGLREAKEAVERLEAGQPLVFTSGVSLDLSGAGVAAGQAAQMAEVTRLVQSGQKIQAIKLYREMTGLGLAEAKEAVERLEAGQPLVFTSNASVDLSDMSAAAGQAAQMAEVTRLVQSGRKIEAIKVYREMTGLGLREAKDAVDRLEAGLGGGGYGGAGAVPMAQPAQARAGRGANRLGCALASCVSALIFGAVTLGVVVSAGLPLGLTSIVRQAVQTAEITPGEEATAMPRALATAVPTVSVADADATAGAKSRSTQQAKTRAANAAATEAAQQTATAAAAEATAEAEAQATAQAIIAAQAAWPVVVSDNFSSNQLGWPVGPSDDDYFTITTTVKSKKFAWVFLPKRSAYANAYPLNPKTYGDFSATVKVKFVQGGEDTNSTAGLVFRHSDPDYGFFGIDAAGHYVVNLVFPGSGLQIFQQAHSDAIQTGTGQVNQLTVRSLGPDLVFLVNDKVAWQTSHDLPEGDMGLGVDSQDKGNAVSLEFTQYEVHAPKK